MAYLHNNKVKKILKFINFIQQYPNSNSIEIVISISDYRMDWDRLNLRTHFASNFSTFTSRSSIFWSCPPNTNCFPLCPLSGQSSLLPGLEYHCTLFKTNTLSQLMCSLLQEVFPEQEESVTFSFLNPIALILTV